MKALIFNYDTKELLYDGVIPKSKTKNKKNFSSLEEEILRLQKEKDIFNLNLSLNLNENDTNKCTIKKLGIKAWKDFYIDRCICNAEYKKEDNSFVPFQEKKIEEPEYIKVYTSNGVETSDLRIAFFFYEEGLVLKTNKSNYNLFGQEMDSYVSAITKTKFCTTSKKDALVFDNYKELYNFISKHKNSLIVVATDYDYQFEIEKISIRDFTPKGDSTIVERLIEEINDRINEKIQEDILDKEEKERLEMEKFFGPLPTNEEATLEEMMEEAEKRLKYMDIYNVCISSFKKENKIYQSEMAGILYGLDNHAKEIVDNLLEYEVLPYHVILTQSTIGNTYDVLYVSKNPKNWYEERLSKNGYIMSYCFNQSIECGDVGTIQIIKINGGLKRIQ